MGRTKYGKEPGLTVPKTATAMGRGGTNRRLSRLAGQWDAGRDGIDWRRGGAVEMGGGMA